jgi:shikimate kinase
VNVIVLIGPPGAGKTTVGEALAARLGVGFQDTDRMVEAKAGKAVAEIFTDDGEGAFRDLERAACAEALEDGRRVGSVVALGGGAVMDPDTRGALGAATVLFLDISAGEAAHRVGLDAPRPLLAAAPRKIWRELMAGRRAVYEALATARLEVDGLTPDQAVENAARLIETKESEA